MTAFSRWAEALRNYLRIDTSNPPGDTRPAADFLERLLKPSGARIRRLKSVAAKVNLLATLEGEAAHDSIVLLHHMDVVPAGDGWSVKPFEGEERDGFLYGRGAIDDKGLGIVQVAAFLELAKAGKPKRTVHLLAVADEEVGGDLGTRYVLEQVPELERAEFVWDEGGLGTTPPVARRPFFFISVAEKKGLWLSVTARGTPGHGSRPHGDQAVRKLLGALRKVEGWASRPKFHPVARQMFRRLGKEAGGLKGLAMRFPTPLLGWALRKNPTLSAMVRDTLAVTRLEAGYKENVIPEKASATLDIRLLPDTKPDEFLPEFQAKLGVGVEVEVLQYPVNAEPTATGHRAFRLMEELLPKHFPGAGVSPWLVIGVTDSRHFRAKRVPAFGLAPFILAEDDVARIHGIDERLWLEGLEKGIAFGTEFLARAAGR